jgi:hypothetical protein
MRAWDSGGAGRRLSARLDFSLRLAGDFVGGGRRPGAGIEIVVQNQSLNVILIAGLRQWRPDPRPLVQAGRGGTPLQMVLPTTRLAGGIDPAAALLAHVGIKHMIGAQELH